MLYSSYERVLFKTLAEYMPHRIYAKDTECRFVFANKAVATVRQRQRFKEQKSQPALTG